MSRDTPVRSQAPITLRVPSTLTRLTALETWLAIETIPAQCTTIDRTPGGVVKAGTSAVSKVMAAGTTS